MQHCQRRSQHAGHPWTSAAVRVLDEVSGLWRGCCCCRRRLHDAGGVGGGGGAARWWRRRPPPWCEGWAVVPPQGGRAGVLSAGDRLPPWVGGPLGHAACGGPLSPHAPPCPPPAFSRGAAAAAAGLLLLLHRHRGDDRRTPLPHTSMDSGFIRYSVEGSPGVRRSGATLSSHEGEINRCQINTTPGPKVILRGQNLRIKSKSARAEHSTSSAQHGGVNSTRRGPRRLDLHSL